MLNSIYFTPKQVKKQPTVCKKSRKKGKYGWLENVQGLPPPAPKLQKWGQKTPQNAFFQRLKQRTTAQQPKVYAGLPLYKHCALRYTNVNQSLLKGEGPPGPLTFFGFLMEHKQQVSQNTAVQSRVCGARGHAQRWETV